MQSNENLYLGIDIGTSKICVSICELKENNILELKGVGTTVSSGINNTNVNKDELQLCILKAIQRAEQDSGFKTKKTFVNIPSQALEFTHNTGFLVSTSESGQISTKDQVECIRRSKNIAVTSNKILLHAIPLFFKVDDTIVQNPIGVFGQKLEVQSHLIFANAEVVNSIREVLNNLGLYINGMMFDNNALKLIMANSEHRNTGCFLIDFGNSSTKVSFIKHDKIHKSLVLPIGSNILTQDLAKCLNTSIPEAERLKIIYANVQIKPETKSTIIEITTKADGIKEIDSILLNQIIQSRIKELFIHIIKKFPILTEEKYPVILGGCGSLLNGLIPFFKENINTNVSNTILEDLKPIIESHSYTNAIGMIFYGLKTKTIKHIPIKITLLKKCKQWVQKFY